jgi:hypothetical protein
MNDMHHALCSTLMAYLFGIDVSTIGAQCDWITAQIGGPDRWVALTDNQMQPGVMRPRSSGRVTTNQAGTLK